MDTLPDRHSAQWMDRLVELHVLTEHGDPNAEAQARQWMSWDAEARAAWDTVTRVCAELTVATSPETA